MMTHRYRFVSVLLVVLGLALGAIITAGCAAKDQRPEAAATSTTRTTTTQAADSMGPRREAVSAYARVSAPFISTYLTSISSVTAIARASKNRRLPTDRQARRYQELAAALRAAAVRARRLPAPTQETRATTRLLVRTLALQARAAALFARAIGNADRSAILPARRSLILAAQSFRLFSAALTMAAKTTAANVSPFSRAVNEYLRAGHRAHRG